MLLRISREEPPEFRSGPNASDRYLLRERQRSDTDRGGEPRRDETEWSETATRQEAEASLASGSYQKLKRILPQILPRKQPGPHLDFRRLACRTVRGYTFLRF